MKIVPRDYRGGNHPHRKVHGAVLERAGRGPGRRPLGGGDGGLRGFSVQIRPLTQTLLAPRRHRRTRRTVTVLMGKGDAKAGTRCALFGERGKEGALVLVIFQLDQRRVDRGLERSDPVL